MKRISGWFVCEDCKRRFAKRENYKDHECVDMDLLEDGRHENGED